MANKTQTIAKTAATKTVQGATAKAPVKALKAPAKTAAAKTASKAKQAPKTEQAPGAVSVVAMIVEGIAKRIEAKSAFYATALAYHARMKTQFPRARNNEVRATLKVEDVATVFEHHDKKILASGNAKAQAMFDVYMMEKTA